MTCIDAPAGHYLAVDHVQFVRHTFLEPSVDYEPCKKKKRVEEIPRFLETFFLKSMKLTRADGEPHAARVTIRSNTHMEMFPPKLSL